MFNLTCAPPSRVCDMCGIAGYVTKAGGASVRAWASATERALRHRGPDDFGHAGLVNGRLTIGEADQVPEEANVAFVHTRLSIIDLSAAGRQPMVTPDSRLLLAFNGEIYNFVELRRELETDHGVRFCGHSDTEVLLASWAVWGAACLDRLDGMFAFAILDIPAGKLFLARDPVGIKPLYYIETGAGFAFCSEPAPLLDWPGASRSVDPRCVVDYLRFGYTGHLQQSMFADVKRVRPGTWLEIDTGLGAARSEFSYWSPEPRPTSQCSLQDAADELRQLLMESVDRHLRSDLPVACCLSGGIDSSSIAMMMRHVGGKNLEIHTFSHVWPGQAFDEGKWIDLVNRSCRAVPHKITSTPQDLEEDLSGLVERQQFPFSTTSVYAQYRVMRALSENGLKVTLDGQGADELFGGYSYHVAARLGSLFRQRRFKQGLALLMAASRLPGSNMWSAVQNMLDYVLPVGSRRVARNIGGKGLVPNWIDEGWCRKHGVYPDPYRTGMSKELLREAVSRSLAGPGLPHLLRYEDENSMAFSVEARVPFLCRPVMEFALSLPEEFLVNDEGETKAVLRLAMRDIVPDAVLDRKEKIAFETPERSWLGSIGARVDSILTSEAAGQVRGLDVQRAAAHWGAARGDSGPPYPVWRWINLIEWTRIFEVEYPD